MLQPPWKTIRNFLIKGNTCLLSDPAILPPGTYPREMTACVPRKKCTRILKSALFIIPQNWKQLKYSSIGKWYNGVTNNNGKEQSTDTVAQMNLKNIMLSMKVHTECFQLYEIQEQAKPVSTRVVIAVVTWGRSGGVHDFWLRRSRRELSEMIETFYILI